jgi:hypothetical protein
MPTRARRPRDLAKEQFWRRIIRRQQQSDLPIRAFCQLEGLKTANFLWWRRELTRRDQEKTASSPSPLTKRPSQPPVAPVFLPVRVVETDLVPLQPAPLIEIVLHRGPVVRVPCGFDPRTLHDILAVLEARPC